MKTRLILLAAGNSRRFGSNKLLYLIDEKPMFMYGLEIMKELLLKDPDRELYVVIRFDPVMKAVEEMNEDSCFKIEPISLIHRKVPVEYLIPYELV